MQPLIGGIASLGIVDAGIYLGRQGPWLLTVEPFAFDIRTYTDSAQSLYQAQRNLALANRRYAVSDGKEAGGDSAVAFGQIGVTTILAQDDPALHGVLFLV